jgi:hypothetical protein
MIDRQETSSIQRSLHVEDDIEFAQESYTPCCSSLKLSCLHLASVTYIGSSLSSSFRKPNAIGVMSVQAAHTKSFELKMH